MIYRVLFIAPYQDMQQIAQEIVNENNLPIKIVAGELYEGVELLKEHLDAATDVIISRGGTAKLVNDSVNIPVVEIKVSPFDLLRILQKHYKKKIAVIGSENVISGVKSIAEILDFKINYFPLIFDDEIKEKIETAQNAGADIIIGDAVAVRLATKFNIESELITSGREAISNAIHEAMKIINVLVQEREKKLELNVIVEYLSEGIIITDEEYRITITNPISERMLHLSKNNASGKNIHDVFQHYNIDFPKRKQGDYLLKINSSNYAVNSTQIILDGNVKGCVYRFENITNIQKLEEKIRKSLAENHLVARTKFNNIIGESEIFAKTIHKAKQYATVDTTVLISGESGTGKELFAQSIHNGSIRKKGPFVAINCATLPGDLLESKLFGYAEGAFTGALKGGKRGLFELAHNGTLFLDEINEMDFNSQARLLRVLQEKEIMRVGGEKNIPVNVRIIAATNKQLRDEVGEKRFREDLFYRLYVLSINIPPLRERNYDVVILSEFFTNRFCKEFNKGKVSLNKKIIDAFLKYSWPGNIRQLENMILKIVLLSDKNNLMDELTSDILSELENTESICSESNLLQGSLMEINKKVLAKILEQESGNKTKTAKTIENYTNNFIKEAKPRFIITIGKIMSIIK